MSNLVALLFGAAIVLLYSYERFNRVTYHGGRQLERLIGLLSPDKLRARRIVMNAYGLYAFTLIVIYLFLCAYAELLPLLGGPELAIGASQLPPAAAETRPIATVGFSTESATSSNAAVAEAKRSGDIGIDASVSLTIALIMVGVAPTFPVLRSFEDWLRGAAHRLAGIPTRVIAAGEELRRRDLNITVSPNGLPLDKASLLISRSNWERLAHYQAAARARVSEPEDFRFDLELIFAVSAWILDRKLRLGKTSIRERFRELEEELAKRKDQLIAELDDRSNYGGVRKAEENQDNPTVDDQQAGERKRLSWERLATNTDNLADDLRIMLALYIEHEIIQSSGLISHDETAHQQSLAKLKLQQFLGGLLHPQSATGYRRSHAMMSALWTVGIVFFLSTVWSLLPGRFEYELIWGSPANPYGLTLITILYAFNNYCVPVIVSLVVRDAGLQARRWTNMWSSHWTSSLPQAALVVSVSWCIATVFVIGLTIWKNGFDTNWSSGGPSIGVLLGWSFEYNAPTAFRGAVLGVMIVLLLDSWSSRRGSFFHTPPSMKGGMWTMGSGLTMFLCGGMTRYLTSWSAKAVGSPGLDSIDRGLILYSALFSALVGACVVFCICQALLNERAGYERRSQLATVGGAEAKQENME